jgi:hypothetical protein
LYFTFLFCNVFIYTIVKVNSVAKLLT